MSALSHIRDPQREGLIALVDELLLTARANVRRDQPCEICEPDDLCAWHRPTGVRSSREADVSINALDARGEG